MRAHRPRVQIVRRAAVRGVEGDGGIVARDRQRVNRAGRQQRDRRRLQRRPVQHAIDGPRVVVHGDDQVLAALRVPRRGHVPLFLIHDGRRTVGERQRAQRRELAALVRRIEEARAVGREIGRRVVDGAFVCGDVARLLRGAVVDEDVGVRRRALLRQRDVPLVARDRADVEAVRVAVEERAPVAVDRDLVDVEVLRIALVGRDEQRLVVAGPAEEVGLQLLARREIRRRSVRRLHVDVGQLVAALIARVEEPVVGGEKRQREHRVCRRVRQRLWRAARSRDGVRIPDPRQVGGHEHRSTVGRPGDAAEPRVLIDVGDRIGGRLDARRGRAAARGAARTARHRRERRRNTQDRTSRAHATSSESTGSIGRARGNSRA